MSNASAAVAAEAETKLKRLYTPKAEPMRITAFMSGTGSNLRKILELQQKLQQNLFSEKGLSRNEKEGLFKVVMIFTDTADEKVCNARRVAEDYKIAYYCNDIKEYYRKRGLSDRKDLKIREGYDAETAKLLRMHRIDVVALCGYMSIVTRPVIGNFLTVNIHPADLRIKDSSGRRKYAGCMGSECVKKAILNSEKEVRSTTHIVTENVDQGQVLLVSKPVNLEDSSSGEELDELAHIYQEKLKEEGDWKVYPETLKMLAEGRFAIDDEGIVHLDDKPIPDGYVMG